MSGSIDFYFDFISPYGYFAAEQIPQLAERHERVVRWHAFHMRAVMKDVLGQLQAPAQMPLKGDYMRRDLRRMARQLGLPYDPAPLAEFSSVIASRVLCLIQSCDPARAGHYAQEIFRSQHARGKSPNSWADCVALAQSVGIDPGALDEATQGQIARQSLREATDRAVAAGVWGTPTVIVDGEPFWGVDRLTQVDAWLQQGGW